MKRIRVSLLGAGWIANRVYVPLLTSADSPFDVVAAHDIEEEALQALARRCGLKGRELTRSACCAKDVDAMIVCTPPHRHADDIEEGLRAGKFVLCEKPVLRTLAEVERISRLPGADRHLMGSASMRFRDDVRLLSGWIADARMGAVETIELRWMREKGVPAAGSWRTDPVMAPNGVLEDLGPHLFDLAASFAAWPEWHIESCRLERRFGTSERAARWFGESPAASYVTPDYFRATLQAGAGLRATFESSWGDNRPGDVTRIDVTGHEGRASLVGLFGFSENRRSPSQFCVLARRHGPAVYSRFTPGPSLQREAFRKSLDHFAAVCRKRSKPVSCLADIAAAAHWITTIHERSGFYANANYTDAVHG
jgi:oxidoreductase